MADWRQTGFSIIGGIALAIVFGGAAMAAEPPTPSAAASPSGIDRPGTDHLLGDYLAGRHAQQLRDFQAAASWFDKAIALDPDSPELISRTFLMEVCVGHFDRAKALAERELKLDPGD